jgi:hypothetical protein
MEGPWIERVIKEAQEAGVFDDVAGSGEPIRDLDQAYDPGWWARRWVAGERQRQETIELVRSVERELPRVLAGTVTDRVRAGLESLNTRISKQNSLSSPGCGLPLLDVAGLMKERSARRGG